MCCASNEQALTYLRDESMKRFGVRYERIKETLICTSRNNKDAFPAIAGTLAKIEKLPVSTANMLDSELYLAKNSVSGPRTTTVDGSAECPQKTGDNVL